MNYVKGGIYKKKPSAFAVLFTIKRLVNAQLNLIIWLCDRY